MAKQEGTKNKPAPRPVGRPKDLGKITETLTPQEIKELKQTLVDLIEAEEADNVTEACDILQFSPLKVYNWMATDHDFAGMVRQSQQIKADRLEADLDSMNHVVARIVRLKKLRPEYRDTHKLEVTNTALETLLTELRQIARKKAEEEAVIVRETASP